MNTKLETLIANLQFVRGYFQPPNMPEPQNQMGMICVMHIDETIAALRQSDQQSQLYRATVIEECRQTIIDLRLPDCEWEKKYNDRFDDGVKAAIHQLNELLKPVEEVERYDCPIHGLQDGPDCARC